jgi:hypothetical protein
MPIRIKNKIPNVIVDKIIQYKSELVFRHKFSYVIRHIKKLHQDHLHEADLWMDPMSFDEFFFGHILCYEENNYFYRMILPAANRRIINEAQWTL